MYTMIRFQLIVIIILFDYLNSIIIHKTIVICILYFCKYTLKMVKCFVPGCKTGYTLDVKQQKSNGLKNKSLFKAPKVKKKNKIFFNLIYK